jgi:type VI secretion system protein ImpK
LSNGDSNDPFAPRDATILRPRPGAGRRGSAEAGAPESARYTGGSPPAASAPASVREFLSTGLNPLVRAASPLLVLIGRLRSTLAQNDVGMLRRQTLEEIHAFEERARSFGVSNETALAARYVLCAAIDEAVLSTPWGGQSEWAGQPLLVALHREAWGGEKFFEMVDRLKQDPSRHLDLLELQYICLALGFEGRFRVVERGQARLAEIQNDLYRIIRDVRGAPEQELSAHWRGVEDRRNPVFRYIPWWVAGAASLLLLTGAFIYFYTRLGTDAAPVQQQLASIGLVDMSAPTSAGPVTGPTLAALLAPEQARGEISVEESGGRAVITLLAQDLFASGSAKVNPAYKDLLGRIAAALNQVPGRVMVVGHTDDTPLRSLRFRDNFELSRERAVDVVNILKQTIENPGRLEWTGVGASQPRYEPANLPENRARNRRVEILHVRD